MAKAKQLWGYKMRKFGGRRYRVGTWHDTKTEAQKRAGTLRGMGYSVRVVRQPKTKKLPQAYAIYAHPDPMKQ